MAKDPVVVVEADKGKVGLLVQYLEEAGYLVDLRSFTG